MDHVKKLNSHIISKNNPRRNFKPLKNQIGIKKSKSKSRHYIFAISKSLKKLNCVYHVYHRITCWIVYWVGDKAVQSEVVSARDVAAQQLPPLLHRHFETRKSV